MKTYEVLKLQVGDIINYFIDMGSHLGWAIDDELATKLFIKWNFENEYDFLKAIGKQNLIFPDKIERCLDSEDLNGEYFDLTEDEILEYNEVTHWLTTKDGKQIKAIQHLG